MLLARRQLTEANLVNRLEQRRREERTHARLAQRGGDVRRHETSVVDVVVERRNRLRHLLADLLAVGLDVRSGKELGELRGKFRILA